ncbi:hypothetical protein GGX14DRAFT_485091, partial [Mycena pura]
MWPGTLRMNMLWQVSPANFLLIRVTTSAEKVQAPACKPNGSHSATRRATSGSRMYAERWAALLHSAVIKTVAGASVRPIPWMDFANLSFWYIILNLRRLFCAAGRGRMSSPSFFIFASNSSL